MAGYIGSKSSVTQVDGYSEAEADAEFVNDPNDAITVSGSNVGIGTSSPSYRVTINTPDENHLRLENGSELGLVRVMDSGAFDFWVHGENSTDVMTFRNGSGAGTERMRIDSSGNLLVGQTTASSNAVGTSLRPDGRNFYCANNNYSAHFNRKSSDGAIAYFAKDDTIIGSIGTTAGTYMYVGSGDTGLLFQGTANAIEPWNPSTNGTRDNQTDLGLSGNRFDDIYATNGTIQTSDFNEKQDIASLTATEMLVGKRISALFKTFRWKDSVAENGDNARTHTGVIAQDVQAAFTAEGLDAGDYALFISSTWWEHDVDVPAVEAVAEVLDEDGNVTTEAVEAVDAYTRTDTYDTEAEAPEGATSKTRMGIRYPELLSFVAAYNEQRFASIEARLTALEA